ncbi:molybdenum cofactor guanylyltransferase [bacterium]|nr:MAG: molybdenum cofactor guanylyltransferase [bacterium]
MPTSPSPTSPRSTPRVHASADLGIVILAGGEATRLPGKLAKPAGAVPLLVHVYRNLAPAGRSVYLSLKEPLPPALAQPLAACAQVYDEQRQRGPVGGLASAFSAMREHYAFVCAGDAPFVSVAHLQCLLDAWREGDQAVVPVRTREGREQWEPLAALYDAPAFAHAAEDVLRNGRGSMREVIERLKARLLPMEDDAVFTNVNTPAEYAAFIERLS